MIKRYKVYESSYDEYGYNYSLICKDKGKNKYDDYIYISGLSKNLFDVYDLLDIYINESNGTLLYITNKSDDFTDDNSSSYRYELRLVPNNCRIFNITLDDCKLDLEVGTKCLIGFKKVGSYKGSK